MNLSISIHGLEDVTGDMERLRQNVKDMPDHVADVLGENMTDVVHVVTGYLRSTIYNRKNVAGATAFYAGVEADRGGEHDFPARAVAALNPEDLAAWVMEGV